MRTDGQEREREDQMTEKMKNAVPIWEKLNLTIEEAVAYSNIGRNKLYEMCEDPRCPFVLFVGKKRLIKRKVFEKYMQEQYVL